MTLRTLAVAILTACSLPTQASYLLLDSNVEKGVDTYVNSYRLHGNQGLVRFWIQLNYATVQQDYEGRNYRSTMQVLEVACLQNTFRPIQVTNFEKPYEEGAKVSAKNFETVREWYVAVPNTLSDLVVTYGCVEFP